MQTTFCGKRISSILGVLPEQEFFFEDEVGNYAFPEKQTLRLKRVMGYEKHRISKPESAASDFAYYGIRGGLTGMRSGHCLLSPYARIILCHILVQSCRESWDWVRRCYAPILPRDAVVFSWDCLSHL